MQALVEAASHIAQEIERTRQHLSNLEQALEGLKPLITVEAATATLTFAMQEPAQTVEDLSVVNAQTPAKKQRKPKAVVQAPLERPKAAKTKAGKGKTGKTKAVESAPPQTPAVAELVKLPATGAELWLKCIGRKKMTVAQITDAALTKLNLDDTAKNVMATRAKTWAYAAVKKGTLIEAGTRDGSKLFQLAPVKAQSQVEGAQTVALVETTPVVEAAPVEEGAQAA